MVLDLPGLGYQCLESGFQINPEPQTRSGSIQVLLSPGAGFWASVDLCGICPELVLGKHPRLVFFVGPPGWGCCSCQVSLPWSWVLTGVSCGSLAKLAGAGQEVLMACMVQGTVTDFLVTVPRCFQKLQNAKTAERLGPLSLGLSPPSTRGHV